MIKKKLKQNHEIFRNFLMQKIQHTHTHNIHKRTLVFIYTRRAHGDRYQSDKSVTRNSQENTKKI